MLEHNDLDAALQVDVEKLRAEYPRTLDLYREVCVVIFFGMASRQPQISCIS